MQIRIAHIPTLSTALYACGIKHQIKMYFDLFFGLKLKRSRTIILQQLYINSPLCITYLVNAAI